MTVPAVALIVNGRSLAAADALLPHAVETADGSPRLRLVFLPASAQPEVVGRSIFSAASAARIAFRSASSGSGVI